ncbi:hypothetical protein LCGC14_2300180 [marine sediment metagenome]|uniref:Uncharacterized protein n=1 Tax=marine sediment metagenome TaxID=412755 RepID=A0A0F9CP66_9ZZZZ
MSIDTAKGELRVGAAKSLGLYVEVTANTNAANSNTLITCPDLKDKAIDNERFQDSFIWRKEGEWRLIASDGVDVPNATITVARAWSNNNVNNVTFGIYGILSLDDWDTVIDEAMQDKFYKDRVTIPLVSGQKEYTPNASWLQTKGQIIRMRWRDESSGATKPIEGEVAVAYVVDVDHGIKVIVPSQPSESNTSLIIEARHYFGKMAADNAIVTLPGRLAEIAVKHEALKLIFQKMGPGAKRVFGQQMVLTERELQSQEARWLDTDAHRDWSDEDEPFGGDPEGAFDWGW